MSIMKARNCGGSTVKAKRTSVSRSWLAVHQALRKAANVTPRLARLRRPVAINPQLGRLREQLCQLS